MIFMLAGALTAASSDTVLKVIGGSLPPEQIFFWRMLFGSLFLLPVLPRYWRGMFDFRLVLINGATLLSIGCWFIGLPGTPLANATLVAFMAPLLIAALGTWFLGERLGFGRWVAIGVSFLGAAVSVVGNVGMVTSGVPWLVAAVLLSVYCQLSIRRFHVRLHPMTIVLHMNLLGLLVSWPVVLGPMVAPDRNQWVLLLIFAGLASLGRWLVANAYRSAEAATVSPMEYSRFVFAVGYSVAVFGDWPDLASLVGAVLIILGGTYLLLCRPCQERSVKNWRSLCRHGIRTGSKTHFD